MTLISKLIFSLLPHDPPYQLSMDRTNWKFGTLNINILMISICYKGVAIPIIWRLLPKKGNSNTEEREEILLAYVYLFGFESIDSFMADREFIGEDWFSCLIDMKIPFYIRIKENMKVIHLKRKECIRVSHLFNT